MHIILVDLPNFYNVLARQFIANDEPDKVHDYFLKWLEMDILSESINQNCGTNENPLTGTYLYYSKRAMGPNKARIRPEELSKFAERTNRESGVTVYEVDVPGEQSESFEFECIKCGQENTAQTTSEKGIDTTIITHLFETMDNWQIATILSHDADYYPAIKALRKMGKYVYAAGKLDGSSKVLVRECHSFIDVFENYLNTDIALFKAFMPNGELSRFVKKLEKNEAIKVSSDLRTSTERWRLHIRSKVKDQELINELVKEADRIHNAFPFITYVNDAYANTLQFTLLSEFSRLCMKCLKRKIQDSYIDFPRSGIEL